MNRVYKKKVNIDQNSLKEFYSKRAQEKTYIDIDAPVVLCGDRDKTKIVEWTNYETEKNLPFAKLDSQSIVLEVGCGTGRITKYITPEVKEYLGIDNVKELIEIARNRDDIFQNKNIHFEQLALQEIDEQMLNELLTGKINRFIISGGVFMYINDLEVERFLNRLSSQLDEHSIIYISEPIALKERLTLDKVFSEDLQSEYSAIYRTEKEYLKFFYPFFDKGFKLTVSQEFFEEDIKGRKETKQWLFVLER